ncbi:MAG: PHP domain-containing protein [Candidatus Dormibacterales bacterium]
MPGRADLHMHTCFSDGWPTPTDLVDHVRAGTGLDVIAVTDHDTIEGARRAAEYAASRGGPHVVVGEEVSSREGHILGLFMTRAVRPWMSAAVTVRAIHDQGGLAFAAHPFWRTERSRRPRRVVHGVGCLAAELDFDGIEVENSTPGLGYANRLARDFNLSLHRTEIGGSDAHILDAVGRAYTSFPGRTPDALRGALEEGRTRAHRRHYDAVALARYAAWGFNHQRMPHRSPLALPEAGAGG